MSTITSLKLGSVPITEEGVERYRFSDNVENHFTQIYERSDDLNCSVGRIFSKMKVPVSWLEIMNANYLIADMIMNNPSGSVLHIKGWIDSIDLISDSEDYPQVEIRWHFDYYEMYKSSVNLGYGHVKRRPYTDLDTTPVQRYQMIKRVKGSESYEITKPFYLEGHSGDSRYRIRFVIFSYNKVDGNGNATETKYGFYPVGNDLYVSITEGGITVPSINWRQTDVNGLFTYFAIKPSQVNGIWISDYPPVSMSRITGGGTPSNPMGCSDGNWTMKKALDSNNDPYLGYFESLYGPTTSNNYTDYDFSSPLVSTEFQQYVIVGIDGNISYTLPYDIPIKHARVRCILQSDSADMEIIFYPDGGDSSREASVIGLRALIPCIELPLLSNAWSEYTYSQQRSYDIEMRQLQTDTGAVKQAASGVGSGAMMGAFGSRGLIIGALGGSIGGLTNYLTETYWQNDKEQELLDRLQANQSPTLIKGGYSCGDVCVNGGFTRVIDLKMDNYSTSIGSSMRANYGISVDEIRGSCDSLVRTELPAGYYSIKNLIISGAAPKEAKDYIKNKFDAGVKLL